MKFYHDLIINMSEAPYSPKWQIGVYPTDDAICSFVGKGEMYVAESEGEFVGAMVINSDTNEGYKGTEWRTDAAPGEYAVIHILGVKPSRGRSGIGSAMVREAIRLAKEQGMKAVRLDVLSGNLPAEKLYLKHDFEKVASTRLFYEDTGWCDFDLYEYVI